MLVKELKVAQLGRRVKAARLKLGLSQEEVADPTYTAAYISHIENGKRRASHEALTHIATRLGMTLEQLVSGRDPDEDLRLEVMIQRAVGQIHSGDLDEALSYLLEARDDAARACHERAVENAESAVALALYRLGRVEEAEASYERTLELTAKGPPERRTTALAGKARCLLHSGEARKAIHLLEAHLIELQQTATPDPACLVEVYAALIPGYFETGLIESAKDAAARGWALAPAIPDVERRACLYVNRAQLMLTQGESREALASLALAEDLYRHLGWRSEEMKVALAKSFVLTDQGDLEAAERLIRDALASSGQAVGIVDRIRALTRLALIHRRKGAPADGLDIAKQALKLARSGFKSSAAEAQREAGLCLLDLGDPDAALDHWRMSLATFVKSDDHEEAAKTARLIGDQLSACGDIEGAAEVYRQGLGSVEELR